MEKISKNDQFDTLFLLYSYLNICIKYGTKDFYITQKEDEEVLRARELRAACFLNMAKYQEAENEAAKILFWNPSNGKALFLYGEALYLQCKVSNHINRCSEKGLIFQTFCTVRKSIDDFSTWISTPSWTLLQKFS